jgi:adenine phosphoribosyltransferase
VSSPSDARSDGGSGDLAARLAQTIRDVADFPRPGIAFKDITPVLADAALFADVLSALAAPWRSAGVTHVVGIESRGFIFGAPVALLLGVGFVPARKPEKLPRFFVSERYALEYGATQLQIHVDAFVLPGESLEAARGKGSARVLVVDDLLATGGTARAALSLVHRLGAEPVGVSAVIDLAFLPWRTALAGTQVQTLISFS